MCWKKAYVLPVGARVESEAQRGRGLRASVPGCVSRAGRAGDREAVERVAPSSAGRSLASAARGGSFRGCGEGPSCLFSQAGNPG